MDLTIIGKGILGMASRLSAIIPDVMRKLIVVCLMCAVASLMAVKRDAVYFFAVSTYLEMEGIRDARNVRAMTKPRINQNQMLKNGLTIK